jgi:beta-barrel assembly-enhancing protease
MRLDREKSQMKTIWGFFLLLILIPQPANADLFRNLQKLADPESKESKIFSGAKQVVASSSDIDYQTERTIGESLALEGMQRYGKPVNNSALQKYINLVGNAVARSSTRAAIPYQFVVIDSQLQNAFACPGGIIFISKALLGLVENEAELAGILAHEVEHVGHKHALSTIRRSQFLQGATTISAASMKGEKGKQYSSMIGDLQGVIFEKGLDKNLEFEADLAGMATAYRAGYNPAAFLNVLKKLQAIEARSEKNGSWFSTHPPLKERIARGQQALAKYPDHATLAMLPTRFTKAVGRSR